MKINIPGIRAFGLDIGKLIKFLSIIIPLAIAGNIVYVVVTTRSEALAELGQINLLFLLLAVVLALAPWITQSIALQLWGRLFKKELSFRQSLKTVLATDLGGAVTPTFLGGGYVKLAFLLKYGYSPSEATLITFLGTLADGVFFAIALTAGVLISQAWTQPLISGVWHALTTHRETIGIILIFFVIGIAFYRLAAVKGWLKVTAGDIGHPSGSHRGIIYRIKFFWQELEEAGLLVIRKGKLTFLGAMTILGIGWTSRYLVISALAYGLGYAVDPVLFFLLQWLVFSATVLIPTPGGIGGAEVSFAIIYRGLLPREIIPLITAVWRFITFYMIVAVGALAFALLGGVSDRKSNPDIPAEVKEIDN